jgi:hypothetical protein
MVGTAAVYMPARGSMRQSLRPKGVRTLVVLYREEKHESESKKPRRRKGRKPKAQDRRNDVQQADGLDPKKEASLSFYM